MPPWPDPDRRPEPFPDPCHAPWHSAESANPGRRTALMLALALGFVGAHRFYLHQPFVGLCYLAFCWTLVPLVLALVDARSLSRMSDCEFHEEYGAGAPASIGLGGLGGLGGSAGLPGRVRVPSLARSRRR